MLTETQTQILTKTQTQILTRTQTHMVLALNILTSNECLTFLNTK